MLLLVWLVFLAEKKDGKPFSRHFVYNFVKRHSDELWSKIGKLTSPTRCLDTMLPLTNTFIRDFELLLAEKKFTEKNILVFDETIIGTSGALPKVVGERRDSGGGMINVFQTREERLVPIYLSPR